MLKYLKEVLVFWSEKQNNKRYWLKLLVIIMICVIFLISCSVEKLASDYFDNTIVEAERHLPKNENFHLVEQSMPTILVLLDTRLVKTDDDVSLLLRAAKMHTLYALLFIEEKDKNWAQLHYDQARKYLLSALKLAYNLSESNISQGSVDKLKGKLKNLPKTSIDYLFWLAMSWGRVIYLNSDNIEYIGDLQYVETLMKRVIQIDELYENGMPHLFLAVLEEDTEEAQKHFQKAFSITKRQLLLVYVMYANALVKKQDKALFEKLLEEAINLWDQRDKQRLNSQYNLINAVAYKQAQELLDNMDDLFPEFNAEE